MKKTPFTGRDAIDDAFWKGHCTKYCQNVVLCSGVLGSVLGSQLTAKPSLAILTDLCTVCHALSVGGKWFSFFTK